MIYSKTISFIRSNITWWLTSPSSTFLTCPLPSDVQVDAGSSSTYSRSDSAAQWPRCVMDETRGPAADVQAPSRCRGPRCNPSGSSDPRRSARRCPAPTWKWVTPWQVGMDARDLGQIHALLHPHLSSPTAPFGLRAPLCTIPFLLWAFHQRTDGWKQDRRCHWRCPSSAFAGF